MTNTLRPPFQYYGSKARLAPRIIEAMPEHSIYVEPYAGSAAVLFGKVPARCEVVNDIDGDIVNFFRVLRDKPADLVRACTLTPYSREEFMSAHSRSEDGRPSDVEKARRWWVTCWQGFNARARTSWSRPTASSAIKRYRPDTPANAVGRLLDCAERLRRVAVEHCDAVELIERMDSPDTVFYLDPPYLASTRVDPRKGYRTELQGAEQHEQLLDIIRSVEGTVILSGYRSDLYDRALSDWDRRDFNVHNSVANTPGKSRRAIESLWTSRPDGVREQLPF